MPPHRIGAQPNLIEHTGVIALDVQGAQLLQPDFPQIGDDVVVDDLLIAVHCGLGPVGDDDLLHPAVQPLLQGGDLGHHPLVGRALRQVGPQSLAGLGQGGVGLVPLHPLAGVVDAELHAHIEQFSNIIIRNILLNTFPGHLHYLFLHMVKSVREMSAQNKTYNDKGTQGKR